MDVAQRLQKLCTFDGNFHGRPASAPSKRTLKSGATASRRSRNAKPGSKGDERARLSQGRVLDPMAYPQPSTSRSIAKGPVRTLGRSLQPGDKTGAYSCNCRLRIS